MLYPYHISFKLKVNFVYMSNIVLLISKSMFIYVVAFRRKEEEYRFH